MKLRYVFLTILLFLLVAIVLVPDFVKKGSHGSDLESLGIVFESSRDAPLNDPNTPGKFAGYTMNVDGSNVKRLTYNHYWEHKPQVSPDGSKILFSIHFSPGHVDETDPGWEIAIMNVDGTELRRLTNNIILIRTLNGIKMEQR